MKNTLYENIFRRLLEGSSKNGKKILLLVHPDIVFETNFKFAQHYYSDVEYHSTGFDYVITHLFYSDKAYEYLGWDDLNTHLYKNFIKMLKSVSNFIAKDKDYSISFDTVLSDYLIDNPGSTIYMAGGYKDLCVKETEKALSGKLGWLIKDTNTTISCYAPLLITNRHNPKLG